MVPPFLQHEHIKAGGGQHRAAATPPSRAGANDADLCVQIEPGDASSSALTNP